MRPDLMEKFVLLATTKNLERIGLSLSGDDRQLCCVPRGHATGDFADVMESHALQETGSN
jgi:hypothetical protein